MVGNTMHVLQVVGWAPIHAVPGLVVPYSLSVWLGIYATWEGLIAQGIATTVVFGSYFVAEFKNSREMKNAIAQSRLASPTPAAQ
jgi:high-affinity iron transporter